MDPAFLQLRLQHHVFATNFYAYAFYGMAARLLPGLFYGRFAKAAIMAFLPPLVYLYLRRRFSFTGSEAFAAAIAIGLLPGIMCFSWIGVDFGVETPIGFLALWLALFESTLPILTSCLAVAIAAGSYGSGLVFVPIVLLHHRPRLAKTGSRGAVIAGIGLLAGALLFPLFWWTNAQALFLSVPTSGQENGRGRHVGVRVAEAGGRGAGPQRFHSRSRNAASDEVEDE